MPERHQRIHKFLSFAREGAEVFGMRSRSIINRLFVLVVLLVVVGVSFVDAGAQQRRNRRSRRVTNPVVTRDTTTTDTPSTSTTGTTDPRIVSTADDQSGDAATPTSSGARTGSRSSAGASLEEEHDSMRTRMNRLSRQVTTLTEKLTEMEKQQRTLVDLERLSRAEQRAENLRAQLREVQMKEADLQARADQLDWDSKPENIERTLYNTGSTRPEEAREARRRQLENEKTRIRSQLDLMTQSRTRLESAIATADSEVDRIRQRVDETNGGASASQTGTGNTNNSSSVTIDGTDTSGPTTTPPPPSGTPR
jgi:chromosome segregation ATPase